MFNLRLSWDFPAKLSRDTTTHTLRIRIEPQGDTFQCAGLPLLMAIALDTSGSMEGEKLESAKVACRTVIKQLRDGDSLSLAGFDTTVKTLPQDNSNETQEDVIAFIDKLQAEGVTRTDLALQWIKSVFQTQTSVVRVGILITDGHATNASGKIVDNLTPLINQAASLGNLGVVLCTVGLGNAQDFHTGFLTDLSDKGKGEFLYADCAAYLEPQWEERLRKSQAIALEGAKLTLKPSPGVIINGFCRFRPEYLPLEEIARNKLNLGQVRSDCLTDVLISVQVPPAENTLDETMENREIIQVELTGNQLITAISQKATIKYTSSYREAQTLNSEENQERLCWEINQYSKELIDIGNDNPVRTGELLQEIQEAAIEADQPEIANQAQEQRKK